MPRTRIPSGRRLRRLLPTAALTVTLTALGSGAVPLLAPAAAAPHPVRTSVHTVSVTVSAVVGRSRRRRRPDGMRVRDTKDPPVNRTKRSPSP